MNAMLFDVFGTLVAYQPDRTRLGSPRTYELARSMGYLGDHDTFVRVWDAASSDLERTARTTLREFSMTDAAIAFGESARLDFTLNDAQELGRSYVYVREWSRHVRPIPGVIEMIRRLAQDVTVGVVSNNHDAEMVPNMLDDMGVRDDISKVVLSAEHGWLKPHPSIYAAALDRVGCAAERAVFVGDSYEADYLGPIEAGMSAFLIDPANKHDIPPAVRLASVLDIAQQIDGHPTP